MSVPARCALIHGIHYGKSRMSGPGRLNKSTQGVVLGLVQLQLSVGGGRPAGSLRQVATVEARGCKETKRCG